MLIRYREGGRALTSSKVSDQEAKNKNVEQTLSSSGVGKFLQRCQFSWCNVASRCGELTW